MQALDTLLVLHNDSCPDKQSRCHSTCSRLKLVCTHRTIQTNYSLSKSVIELRQGNVDSG